MVFKATSLQIRRHNGIVIRPNTTPVNENKATFAFEHSAQFRTLKIEYPRILLRADFVAIIFDFVAEFLTFLFVLQMKQTMFARSKTPMYPWCNGNIADSKPVGSRFKS